MARSLALVGEIPARESTPRLAIARKGFRPFFLLAAIYAVAIVPVWLAMIAGVTLPNAYLDPLAWHAHEMIFGFTMAVIAGFLLTAVGNWTQRETVVGAPLLALVIARPLVATKNRRNFVMVGMLAALTAANVVVHLDGLHVLRSGSALRACAVAIDVIVLMILVISGRVIPMFTRNATRRESIRSLPKLDGVVALSVVALVIAETFAKDPRIPGAIAVVAGVLAFARTRHWGSRHTFREPLLWILHKGHAWAALGLLMRGGAAFIPVLSSSLATHAITVGAIGSLTLGMMSRVSLGHSGRALATPRGMRAAFVAMSLAAFVRVFAPLFVPERTFIALLVAGTLWTLAFATFIVVYAAILATPRVDGKPG